MADPKIKWNPWFTAAIFTAFGGIISFFQINSYFADRNNLNWLFVTLGIILCGATVWLVMKANKTSTGKPG